MKTKLALLLYSRRSRPSHQAQDQRACHISVARQSRQPAPARLFEGAGKKFTWPITTRSEAQAFLQSRLSVTAFVRGYEADALLRTAASSTPNARWRSGA